MAKKASISKELAGLLGAILGFAILAIVSVQLNQNFTRSKRAIIGGNNDGDDYEDYNVEMDGDDDDGEFFDDWSNPNSTDMWADFVRSVGGTIEEDDVSPKQRRINWNRLRENQLAKLHENMLAEFATHFDALSFYNEISGVDYGRRDPSEFGEDMDDEGDYTGFDKTAPVVQKFVDAFECKDDGTGTYAGGQLNFWFLMPMGVPLFSDKGQRINDYSYYWSFFQAIANSWPTDRSSNVRFSVGSYGNNAAFNPRGFKYRNNVPWGRIQRFYKKPKMQASRPKIFSAIRSLMTYLPRYGVSTAASGSDCVLIWLFQDVPRDLNDFMVPEEYEMINEMNALCTVVPVVIAPNAKSDEKTHEQWRKFTANLIPGMRDKFSKDPDFSGPFFVDSHKDLMDPALLAHVHKYLCLVKNRATCRIVVPGWTPPSSEAAATATEGGFRGIGDDYEATEEVVTDAPDATVGGTVADLTTAKVPEIDSCCGHNSYTSTPFDSELKTCCENGKVMAYQFEGDDPCLSDDSFNFRK